MGKIRLVQSPWINHSWHTTLYVTARGLTTSPIPYGTRTFQIDFDFISHMLVIQTGDADAGGFLLQAQSVAAFYRRLMAEMDRLELHVKLHAKPSEVADPIPFEQDETHCAYDAEYVTRFWQILVQADRVFKQFRSRFIGKCSPVHFFWGAADLAVTRFSGRLAPQHPGGVPGLPDWVTREAYSHEVSSCGFWPGGGAISYPAFYSYAYPEPAGYAKARIKPEPRLSTAPTCASSYCRMRQCGKRNFRMQCYSISCRQRMRRQPIWANGIAPLLNGTTIRMSGPARELDEYALMRLRHMQSA